MWHRLYRGDRAASADVDSVLDQYAERPEGELRVEVPGMGTRELMSYSSHNQATGQVHYLLDPWPLCQLVYDNSE